MIARLAPFLAAPPRVGVMPDYRFGDGESRIPWLRRLRRRVWRRLARPCVVRWRDGLRLQLHPGSDMASAIYLAGCYEPNEIHWLSGFLQRGGVAIDVGANIGFFTLPMARFVGPAGRVIALEPSTRERDRLAANLRLNGIDNVTVVPAAAGNAPGQAVLQIAREPHGGQNTFGRFVYGCVKPAEQETVAITTIDQQVAALDIDRLDLIKIDAEGAELRVLQGAARTLRTFRPALLIELNDMTLEFQGASSREVLGLLGSLGYAFHAFAASGALEPTVPPTRYADSVNVVALPQRQASQAAA